jgi:galactokinase
MTANEMGPVPVTKDISEIYTADAVERQKERWRLLREAFSAKYGKHPEFVARSPGRVNIIGEHIDYSLYEVLPMGIAEDVLIAVSVEKNESPARRYELGNVTPSKFKDHTFTLAGDSSVSIDASTHEWSNYFKAGFSGALQMLKRRDLSFKPVSMSIMVDGTVPAGGGLSSSAAFVCASALATLYAHSHHKVSKQELVELAIVSERSVGVNSGGMDQSASVFALRGQALAVSFSPTLRAEVLPFPETDPPITFMIAQTFVAADKHVTGPVCYNLRVVECTLAAEYLAAKFGLNLKDDSGPLGTSLRGLQNAYFAIDKTSKDGSPETEMAQLKAMLELVQIHLPDESGYNRETIAKTMNVSIPDLEKRFMTKFPIRAEKFLLKQRAQHVFSEAIRVQSFKTLLKSVKPTTPEASVALLQTMGELMNETQTSCREVYDCSCPELDELCTIAREAGSYGSRLTGAGWGGCSVHLVPKDKVDAVRKAWKEEYYLKKSPDISQERLASAVVVSEPGSGAYVWTT